TEVHRLARLEPVLYAHAGVVAVFGCAFLFLLGYLAARRSRAPRLFWAAIAVLAVLLVQVGLGELQYRLHLPWYLVLLHVGVAATAWAGIVALAYAFWRPDRKSTRLNSSHDQISCAVFCLERDTC